MNTVANSLEQLRPNITPDPINWWWPIAYGWWVVAFIVLTSTTIIAIKLSRHWLKNRYRKQAAKQLKNIYKQYNTEDQEHEFVHHCNRLLKKIALRVYPSESVAKLCGEDWLNFLTKTSTRKDFISGHGKVLGDLRFQSKVKVDTLELYNLIEYWIQKHYV